MKKMLTIASATGILAIFSASPMVVAKPFMDKKPQQAEQRAEQERPSSQHKSRQNSQQRRDDSKHEIRDRFNQDERHLIQDYYQHNSYEQAGGPPNQLPPGLQKKYERTGTLPPGWQKKVQPGQVLSRDIYSYGREIPYDLRRQLPIGPVGSKILEVEGKIIRVMEGSRMILDVFNIR